MISSIKQRGGGFVEAPQTPVGVMDSVGTLLEQIGKSLEADGIVWGVTERVWAEAYTYIHAVVEAAVNRIIYEWNAQMDLEKLVAEGRNEDPA